MNTDFRAGLLIGDMWASRRCWASGGLYIFSRGGAKAQREGKERNNVIHREVLEGHEVKAKENTGDIGDIGDGILRGPRGCGGLV